MGQHNILRIGKATIATYSWRLKRSFIEVTNMIASPPKRMRIWYPYLYFGASYVGNNTTAKDQQN
jgi:hypothetical protein